MISKRALSIDSSGIRRVFDLAAKLEDPVNLSIGQPDFDAPPAVKQQAIAAIESGKNSYTRTQGIDELRAALRKEYEPFPDDFDVFITSGVSAGLLLSYFSLLDPGDEILIPDPYFCMYRDLAYLVNAIPTYYYTYPSFELSLSRIEQNITSKTKAILVSSPSNPTGYACTQDELDGVVQIAKRHKLFIIYDEIYSCFCYDHPHAQCLYNYERTIVVNGFSKSGGVPGWRIAYVIAPKSIAEQMLKIQQYTFVCANSPSQWASLPILEHDFTPTLEEYRKKRDFVVEALSSHYSFVKPSGAFYLFPEAPDSQGQAFVEKCIAHNLLLVPGNVFSRLDTHFRISFSASMETLERGVEILRAL